MPSGPARRRLWRSPLAGIAARFLAGVIAFAIGAGAVAYAWDNVNLSAFTSLLPSPAPRAVATPVPRAVPTVAPAAQTAARAAAAPTPTAGPPPTPIVAAPGLVAVAASSPQEAVQGYYDALLAKDYPKAYSYWSAERRRTTPYQSGLVEPESQIKAFSFTFHPLSSGDTAAVESVARNNLLASGRQQVVSTWTVVKEPEGWRLDQQQPAGESSAASALSPPASIDQVQADPGQAVAQLLSKPARGAKGRARKGD